MSIEELKKYISDMAHDELDKIKKEKFNEEQFLDIERKIVLQSIDELWMNHIDSMSKLREEVAFE
jgi:preprotein translocase subunit SecA